MDLFKFLKGSLPKQSGLQKTSNFLVARGHFHSSKILLCLPKFPKDFSDEFSNSMIVGCEHSYVKMNWIKNFDRHLQKPDQMSLIDQEKEFSVSASKFQDEFDESDDIELIKEVIRFSDSKVADAKLRSKFDDGYDESDDVEEIKEEAMKSNHPSDFTILF